MLARLEVTTNADSYKNLLVHDKTMREISKPFETNFQNKNNVHSGLYQHCAFNDNNMYRLSTPGLSLYPKGNKHLHYAWIVMSFVLKKGQLYTYPFDSINCPGVLTPPLKLFAKGREN